MAAQTKEKQKDGRSCDRNVPKVRAVLPGESLPTESVFENRGMPVDLPSGKGHRPSLTSCWSRRIAPSVM